MVARSVEAETRLLEEYRTLEYILLGDLRDLLEEPPDEQNRRWLRAILHALLDTLPREFALRQQGGYLSEVVDQHPNWCGQVDSLQEEKRHLYERLQQLHARLLHHESFRSVARQLRGELRDWINHLVAHHRHERRLVQSAFNTEVGVGD
jgi:hypothetical protein